jgi:hypothetical protein
LKPASGNEALLWAGCRRSTIKLGLLCGDLRCRLGLRRGLCDLIGLVNSSFNYLLFLGVEVLRDILVESGLLLLEAYA